MKRYMKLLGVLSVSAVLTCGCAGINSNNDLEGMEAAAVEPEVAEMILDRPFLFAVHDYRNDVWLFLGVCGDPPTEGENAVTAAES